jgi:hypothetical protein
MRILYSGLFLVCLTALTLTADGTAGGDKPEPGFDKLFNGKNLDGWKEKKDGKSLEGKMEAYGGRFKVMESKLIIDPKVKGDVIIETTKEFAKDVHIKFDYFPGDKCNNDLFFRGIKFDLKKGIKNIKEGEWNAFEIIAEGNKVTYKSNGTVERVETKEAKASTLGIRAEFGYMEVKNLRAKESAS